MISVFVNFNTTLIFDECMHRLKSLTISSNNNNLLFGAEKACDRGELAEGTHEDGYVSERTSEFLLPHHEATISSDSGDFLRFNKEVDSIFEILFTFFIHGIVLAHLEGELRNCTIEDIVVERFSTIDISW
jgi:hypothetical protein